MGQAPDELSTTQIQGDIEDTRSSLTADLDELTDRLSPSNVAHRQVDKAKAGVVGVKDKIMGSAHDVTASAKDKVMGTAHDVHGTASNTSGAVGDRLSSAKHSASDATGDATSAVKSKTQGNPLAAGVVAFGLGLLVSSLIPATQKEAEATGKLVDVAKDKGAPVLDQAKDALQDVRGSVQETAKGAAQAVGESARDAAQTVKSDAQGATEEVRGHGQEAATEVRDTARNS